MTQYHRVGMVVSKQGFAMIYGIMVSDRECHSNIGIDDK